ncbi:MAG TPA: peroxidase, partial [Cyanobacteria bacterium UBA11148]|nr:peroxidase [Cyanobacteria bacterium UBA11148]
GQVGSRIIAEVFVGLLEADSSSFLVRNPYWKPTLPAEKPGTFTMADLLKFVGDVNPIG